MYCKIYIIQVVIIQKNYRMYRVKKDNYYKIKLRNKKLLREIEGISLMPPDKDIKLLKNGGFRYRECEKSFKRYRKEKS